MNTLRYLWGENRLLNRTEVPGGSEVTPHTPSSNEPVQQDYRNSNEACRAFNAHRAKVRPTNYSAYRESLKGSRFQPGLDALRTQYKTDFEVHTKNWQQQTDAQKIESFKRLMAVETKFYNDAQRIFDAYDQYKVEREILVNDLEIELPNSDPTVYFDGLKLSMGRYDSDTVSTEINGMGKISRKGRGFIFKPDAKYRGKIKIAGQRESYTIDQLVEKYAVVQTPKVPEVAPAELEVEPEVEIDSKEESESGIQMADTQPEDTPITPPTQSAQRRTAEPTQPDLTPAPVQRIERAPSAKLKADTRVEERDEEEVEQPVMPEGVTQQGRTFTVPFDRNHTFSITVGGQTWQFNNPSDYTSGTSTFTARKRRGKLAITLKRGHDSMIYRPNRGQNSTLVVEGGSLPRTPDSRSEVVTEPAVNNAVSAEVANLSPEERDAYDKWLADGTEEFTTDRKYSDIDNLESRLPTLYRVAVPQDLHNLIAKYKTDPEKYGQAFTDVLNSGLQATRLGGTSTGTLINYLRSPGRQVSHSQVMQVIVREASKKFAAIDAAYNRNNAPSVLTKINELEVGYNKVIEGDIDAGRLAFYKSQYAEIRRNLNNPYLDKTDLIKKVEELTVAITQPETDEYSEYRIFESQMLEMQKFLFSDEVRQAFENKVTYVNYKIPKERRESVRDSIWTSRYDGVGNTIAEDWNMLLNIAHQMPGTAQERIDYMRSEMPNLMNKIATHYRIRSALYERGGSNFGKYAHQYSNGLGNINSLWRKKYKIDASTKETLETYDFSAEKTKQQKVLHPGQELQFTVFKDQKVEAVIRGMQFRVNEPGRTASSNTGTVYVDKLTERGNAYIVSGLSGVTNVEIDSTGSTVIVRPINIESDERWKLIKERRNTK